MFSGPKTAAAFLRARGVEDLVEIGETCVPLRSSPWSSPACRERSVLLCFGSDAGVDGMVGVPVVASGPAVAATTLRDQLVYPSTRAAPAVARKRCGPAEEKSGRLHTS